MHHPSKGLTGSVKPLLPFLSTPTNTSQPGRSSLHRRRSLRSPDPNLSRRPPRSHPLHANNVHHRNNRHDDPNCQHNHRHVPRRPRPSRLRRRRSRRHRSSLPLRNLLPRAPRPHRRHQRLRHLLRHNDQQLGGLLMRLRSLGATPMAAPPSLTNPLGHNPVHRTKHLHALLTPTTTSKRQPFRGPHRLPPNPALR